MKYRTDFVTNSSSSSFVLTIRIELIDGSELTWEGKSDCGEGNYDYISLSARKSPKDLGNCKSVAELANMLQESIVQGFSWQEEEEEVVIHPVFNEESPFIKSVNELESMDDIYRITIEGYEDTLSEVEDEPYASVDEVTYDRRTKEETGRYFGFSEIESEGAGGALEFSHYSQKASTPEGYFEEKRRKLNNSGNNDWPACIEDARLVLTQILVEMGDDDLPDETWDESDIMCSLMDLLNMQSVEEDRSPKEIFTEILEAERTKE